jgi:hypothetical protein
VSLRAELERAIGHYHDGLSPDLAAESAGWLAERLAQRGLQFGDRPLCTTIRPRFLVPRSYARIRAAGAALARAFTHVHRVAMARPDVLAQFHLTDWEHILAADEDGQPWPSPLSRYDAFFTADGEGLKFTENNAETPAGSAYGDVLSELFLGLPGMAPFLARYEVRPLPSRPPLLHTMLAAYRAATGRCERPVIGIIDWREVPTQSEFREMAMWLGTMGFTVVIADPRELEYTGGKLRAGPTVIDLVYKRILIAELVQREGLQSPLVRAVRERAAVMVNPFRCKVLHKKASLAVLSDERNEGLFDAEMRSAITKHIPWTRVVEDRRTTIDGVAVELLPFLAIHRDRFVLKPNDDYGGAGIVLGWEVSDAEWSVALGRALEAPHIVQERIHLPEEPFPAWADGGLDISDRIVDTAPYVFGGSWVDGCLSRISTAALVNVTAGGGSTVPTFVVSPR